MIIFQKYTQQLLGNIIASSWHATKCILNDEDCAKDPAVTFKAHQINDLVQCTSESMNTMLALHGYPCPDFMPSMINAVKSHYNGAYPVIILSEWNIIE